MPSRSGGTRFIGHQYVYFTPDDWRDVSVALKTKFPAIRFSHCPSFANVDRAEAEQLLRTVRPRWFRPRSLDEYYAIPEEDRSGSFVPDRQPNWPIRYTDVIEADPSDSWTRAWIEPPGWSPVWRIGLSKAEPGLVNPPSLNFHISHSLFINKKAHTRTLRNSHDDREPIRMIEGAWHGSCLPWEDDVRRFLGQVRRIVAKHSTNDYAWVHYERHVVVGYGGLGAMDRIGFHALDWARAHPDHWIGGNSDRNYMKPRDWEPPVPLQAPVASDHAAASDEPSRLFVHSVQQKESK